MNMIKLKQSILAIIIGLALSAGISYAASWVGPTANPPLNNTDAPVNVGGTTQYKTGALGIGGLFTADSGIEIKGGTNKDKWQSFFPFPYDGKNYIRGTTIIADNDDKNLVGIGTNDPKAKLDVNGNLKLTDGTQGAGKVLTSDVNGNASWQNDQGGGTLSSSYVGSCTAYGENTFSLPRNCTCGQGEKIMFGVNDAGGCTVVNQGSANVYGWGNSSLKGTVCNFSCFK